MQTRNINATTRKAMLAIKEVDQKFKDDIIHITEYRQILLRISMYASSLLEDLALQEFKDHEWKKMENFVDTKDLKGHTGWNPSSEYLFNTAKWAEAENRKRKEQL
jgi:hypothetical protein